jgi:hypothetical protein
MLQDETVEDIDELPLPNHAIFPQVRRRHLAKRLPVPRLPRELDQLGLELTAPAYQVFEAHRRRHVFTSAAGHRLN